MTFLPDIESEMFNRFEFLILRKDHKEILFEINATFSSFPTFDSF